MSRRTEKIGEQLRSELATLLLREVTDPRIQFVTLLRVDVAPDLSSALVFWSMLETPDGPSREVVQAGLESAASFLRRRLAQEIDLRRMPALLFRYDPSLAKGDAMLSLLKNLRNDPKSSA